MADGYSSDGYLIDQDYMGAIRYRGMSSDINGCGPIAVFNLLRALGFSRSAEQVFGEMDAMIWPKIPGPTPNRVLIRYLRRHVPLKVLRGRARCAAGCGASPAGILRYWEGREPHFVAFTRLPDGRYRFFNVADGLEDCRYDMPDFFRERCRCGSVWAFLPPAAAQNA